MGRGTGSAMWLLCLLFSVDVTLAQSNKVPSFGLFISPDLYSPSTDTFCLHSSPDLQGYSQISVDLKTSSGTVNLYTVQADSPRWHCQTFQVPEPSGDMEKVTITVQGQKTEGKQIEFSSKELTLRKKKTGTFIQTDKAVYKPGQKVMFRIVTLDQDLEVLNKTYPLVELQDPQKNRLAQWKDVRAESRIAEVSHELSPEAQSGKYNIKAEDTSQGFTVEEYVLPKFGVTVEGPGSVSIMDDNLSITVVAKYTYGEKVQGNANLKVCQKKRPMYWGWWRQREEKKDKSDDLCFTHNAKTDSSGKLQSEVKLSQFNMRDSEYARELEVEASLEEEGTEVTFSAPKKIISLKSELTKLSFKDTKGYYQPGAPYRGKLVLESYDGKRLADKKVHLSIQAQGKTQKETYVTNSAGEVPFQLPTSNWGTDSVSIRATSDDQDEPYIYNKVPIRYGSAYLYLDGIHVTTNSSVYIHPIKSSAQCHENVMVTVDFTTEEQDGEDVDFFYVVFANNRVTHGGEKKVKKSDNLSRSFQFPIPIVDISPSGKLLVFTVSKSGGIAADTAEAQVTPCLKHKVSLRFSEAEALPGSDTKLHLQANGGSMCALRAVDKSVVMMKPEAELTESKIQNLVQVPRSYISQRLDYNYCRDKEPKPRNIVDSSFSSDSWRWWGRTYPEKKKDIQNMIQDMGVHIVTSWDIVAPTICKMQRIRPYAKSAPGRAAPLGGSIPMARAPAAAAPSADVSESFEDVLAAERGGDGNDGGSSSEPRTFFPETWLWELKEVPESGSVEIPVTVPDTITEWSAQSFCIGPGGLGLSLSTSITAFKPFFIDLKLPYKIKRGESFTLRAPVFNYLSQPMQIVASLSPSDQFTIKDSKAAENTFCLPGGVKRTVSWDVTPTIIGQMNITVIAEAVKSQGLCGEQETVIPKKGSRDVVIRSVLVEPEGTVVEQTHNSLLICDGNSVSEKVKFELPASYVPGSEKAFISVCGDIMGPSMSNIGDLLKMSYGCGEQNMVLFAPNVYILQYLKNSDQLNPTVLAKGKDMLEKGYTRQLMYKHQDGSYSAFGKSDGEGSTWLTAFVVKSFGQAKNVIFIDDDVMNAAVKWIKAQQKQNGCFKPTGRLLNNGLKGGVDDEISLTSYIIIALLESGTELSDPIVERALNCIENETLDNASPYKLALKAHAFTLAKRDENRAAAMEKLNQQANKTGGLLYWTQEPKSDPDSYWSKPRSADVEMTSYGLLSLAFGENPTKRDLDDMSSMARWLSKQQNANGGFSSTQDTLVALQALAKYGSLLYRKPEGMTVDVTGKNGFQKRFSVDKDNRLLLQQEQLPEIPGEYTVTASGSGNVIMQIVQRHNTVPDAKKDAFFLSAKPECVKSDEMKISLEFRYTGKRPSTNMALAKVNMLSGYKPDKESAENLKKNPMVNRVEVEEDSVSIYLEKVTSELQTLELTAKKIVPVTDLKPAITYIFDYYMPEEKTTSSYMMNC